jgi:hypothetical protein
LEAYNQAHAGREAELGDARHHPRFKTDVAVCVYPRNRQVIRGHSVDISESGLSAMLQVEVPVGEVVRLEFALDFGAVELHATVRQRCAFRYGFQFLELGAAQDIIRRSCAHLALQESLKGTEPSQ